MGIYHGDGDIMRILWGYNLLGGAVEVFCFFFLNGYNIDSLHKSESNLNLLWLYVYIYIYPLVTPTTPPSMVYMRYMGSRYGLISCTNYHTFS